MLIYPAPGTFSQKRPVFFACASLAITAGRRFNRLAFLTLTSWLLPPHLSGGSGIEVDFRIFIEQFHCSEQNTEEGGPQMKIQVPLGLPLRAHVNKVLILDIHGAMAAVAAMLVPNRAKD